MKRFLKISLCLVFAILLQSCNKNSPEYVAKKFLQNFFAGNFKEAKKYSDKPTAQILTLMENYGGVDLNKEKIGKVQVKITRVDKQEKDKAKVWFIIKEKGKSKEEAQEEQERSIDVRKVDGKWKVSMGKENTPKEELMKGKDHEHHEQEIIEDDITPEGDEIIEDDVFED